MFLFTPLANSTQQSAQLVEIDDVRILIDCGWTESMPFEQMEQILANAPKIDAILLSHASVKHLGAYPYLFSHLQKNLATPTASLPPVYATLPVTAIGRTSSHETYASSSLSPPFPPNVIDAAFDHIQSLRFSQPTRIMGGVSITAFNAGHTLGGTIWKLERGGETVVVAGDWNHARERVFASSVLFNEGQVLGELRKPGALVLGVGKGSNIVLPRKRREEALLSHITTTLSHTPSSTILIPLPPSPRLLELAYLLEQHWRTLPAPQPPLYLLSSSAGKTIQYAKSMLEWMSEEIGREFGAVQSGGPFEFKHLKVVGRWEQCKSGSDGKEGMVVMVTGEGLEGGLGRRVFVEDVATNPQNLLLLTQETTMEPDSLAGKMWSVWDTHAPSAPEGVIRDAISAGGVQLRLKIREKALLEGDELTAYQEEEASRQARLTADTALEMRNRSILEADLESEEESEDDEDDHHLTTGVGGVKREAVGFGSEGLFDLYVRGHHANASKSRPLMFPFVERRRRFDDFGEVLRAEDFAGVKEDEQVDIQQAVVSVAAKGKKRKWDEVAKGKKKGEEHNATGGGGEDGLDERPSKIVDVEKDVVVHCKIAFVDMEGLRDGRAMERILPMIGARKLILVGGDEADTQDLRLSFSTTQGITQDIFSPEVGETVNASMDVNAYDLKLSDALLKTLKWQKLGTHEVAHVTGKISIPTNDDDAPTATALPVLEPLSTPADFANAPRAAPLHVGDIKLADLRAGLRSQGITAEFMGEGTLLCDGVVAVRKVGAGRVVVEGGVGEVFWRVRGVVYGMVATV
ncbi:Metallo-hydrolase/oxidoreductase [Saitoella complicata NRRL Y-17804]|uniref:Cleavage and polyadenylation specificity factor subunit 2 n=1 Tax=Saitoella complicata (strain BCRC 22490 / CBS 7301 / JCM 7358 / NBRC 10748 / NRRL Y-17804) TaxID=698492 RepID=A0A0E9NBY2_SAICN|nr:Metallo-hydrolase/oxidoreductase [Saitoella complicata NRRL Y-17804]ODQ51602.1 Metallo-hydrolase/oxidoreductase [Saitoella complicata NRRL Y-17804]GAO47354.1 hypothetical protein G7K_1562-t1 [Saitoella complicata NRRL Y-17804]